MAEMADKKLKEINQAYECLTDRVQFDKYASKLAQKQSEATAQSKAQKQAASQSSAATAGNGGSPSASTQSATASATPPSDKSGIVKIFLATGLFVIIVVLVANLTAPRRETPTSPGITLSPSESPGAPFSGPRTFTPQPPTLPPDSSIAPPPGSN